MDKVYRYKNREFKISEIAKPAEGEVVYFTSNEWLWVKDGAFDDNALDAIWNEKKRDCRAVIVMEVLKPVNPICEMIILSLKGHKYVEQDEEK